MGRGEEGAQIVSVLLQVGVGPGLYSGAQRELAGCFRGVQWVLHACLGGTPGGGGFVSARSAVSDRIPAVEYAEWVLKQRE